MYILGSKQSGISTRESSHFQVGPVVFFRQLLDPCPYRPKAVITIPHFRCDRKNAVLSICITIKPISRLTVGGVSKNPECVPGAIADCAREIPRHVAEDLPVRCLDVGIIKR